MKRVVFHAVGALVVAGTLALPALAAEHPNDRAGMLGVGAVAVSTPSATTAKQSGRPDGRAMPDSVDLAPTSLTIVAEDNTFDWHDAGIGLAAGLGLALVLGGILIQRTVSRHPAAIREG